MIQSALYIIATPIGNKEDITLRALRLLKEVDLIAAEDTRHSKNLLQHYQITTPLISLHEFNEAQRIPVLLEHLQNGKSIALISDAGTPLISDPGFLLVKAVRAANIQVVPIPGPCAAITALCASGFPTNPFVFEGFLPQKKSHRQARLKLLQQEPRTLAFYEAPHRILDCVQDIVMILGGSREVVLAKELTKAFETFFQGAAQAAVEWLQKDIHHQKGEFVILVHGAIVETTQQIPETTLNILKVLSEDLSTAQAIKLTAQITGEKKNALKALCFRTEE